MALGIQRALGPRTWVVLNVALGLFVQVGCGSTGHPEAGNGGAGVLQPSGGAGAQGSAGSVATGANGGAALGSNEAGARSLGGSSAGAGTPATGGTGFVPPVCDEIKFADATLEAAVRQRVQNAAGPLSAEEGAFIEDLLIASDITSLQGVECLPNLTSLNVVGTFPSLEPLRGLTHLRSLYVHSGALTDTAALSSLSALEKLSLAGLPASDGALIGQLKNLRELVILRGATPAHLSAVCACPKLTYLRLEGLQLSDLAGLASCTSVTALSLQQNAITDASPLRALNQLQSLDLAANQLTVLTPLTSLSSLVGLGVGANKIADFAPLAQLQALTQVDANSNISASLSPFVALPNLTNLDLRRTALDCAGEAPNVTALKQKLGSLFLSDCP